MKNLSVFSSQKRISRRGFLGLFFVTGAAMAVSANPLFAAEAPGAKNAVPAPKKPLIVYFSHSGNTRNVAMDIQKKTGADIVEIKTAKAYPDEYNALTDYAKVEQQNNARPELSNQIPNLDDYGVIFLGYPNWWSSMPMPVWTFIEKSKMDGKTIAPFATHGGGGLGHSVEDLKKLAPHSKILKPLAVNGTRSGSAMKTVEKWLEDLGPALIMTTTGNPAIYPNGGY